MGIKIFPKAFHNGCLEPLEGTENWYWSMAGKDVETVLCADEIDQSSAGTRLYLIHYPEGTVYEPLPQQELFYMAQPVWDQGRIGILALDRKESQLLIYAFLPETGKLELLDAFSQDILPDLYGSVNVKASPLMIVYEDCNGITQMLWPQKRILSEDELETFICQEGKNLYFTVYDEESDENRFNVREVDTGETIATYRGTPHLMPDGSVWLT